MAVDDEEIINTLIGYYNSAEFLKGKSNDNTTGWSYSLGFYDEKGILAEEIVIMPSNRIDYKSYFYNADSDETIDISYIEGLFVKRGLSL